MTTVVTVSEKDIAIIVDGVRAEIKDVIDKGERYGFCRLIAVLVCYGLVKGLDEVKLELEKI